MKPVITDPEVLMLASIAHTLREHYIREGADDPWTDSPFGWIRARPSRQVGKIGEELVARWCAGKGLDVMPGGDPQVDLIIAGRRVEIKFSTLWGNGLYVFQQIRNQSYEYVICLGIAPFDAHCWVIPKEDALRHATPQHTGRSGRDTYWLSINPNSPPDWLKKYGGRLADACAILQQWKSQR